MEEWRRIPGYPARFEVSNFGRVRTTDYEFVQPLRGGGVQIRYRKGRVLSTCVNYARGGYAQVTMTYSDLGRTHVWSGKVHRLVALAFIPNPAALPEVNHKDSDKLNNSVDNLEWVTKAQNTRHSYESGTRKPHKKKRAIVGARGDDCVFFESLLAAQKSGRFTMAAIQRCLKGAAKHHKGYTWAYADSDGQPYFDENGKVKKGPRYVRPDLTGLY